MAITGDDHLAAELNKRIIFGESPEVLSSNYRMTEFQAAVGVEQLKKMPRYLKTYTAGRKVLDQAIAAFDKRKWGHFDEHSMFAVMEGLRDRFPQKLSHAGPRKFAYHELS